VRGLPVTSPRVSRQLGAGEPMAMGGDPAFGAGGPLRPPIQSPEASPCAKAEEVAADAEPGGGCARLPTANGGGTGGNSPQTSVAAGVAGCFFRLEPQPASFAGISADCLAACAAVLGPLRPAVVAKALLHGRSLNSASLAPRFVLYSLLISCCGMPVQVARSLSRSGPVLRRRVARAGGTRQATASRRCLPYHHPRGLPYFCNRSCWKNTSEWAGSGGRRGVWTAHFCVALVRAAWTTTLT
jgi:hypothetical protein